MRSGNGNLFLILNSLAGKQLLRGNLQYITDIHNLFGCWVGFLFLPFTNRAISNSHLLVELSLLKVFFS